MCRGGGCGFAKVAVSQKRCEIELWLEWLTIPKGYVRARVKADILPTVISNKWPSQRLSTSVGL